MSTIYEYNEKITSPGELHRLVQHLSNSLEIFSNVYLGIGTYPLDPYDSCNWKNKYLALNNYNELDIIRSAMAVEYKAIIYFVDRQYQRIFDENGWIYICNSLNQIFNELGELSYNEYYAHLNYGNIKLVYFPIHLPTDYNPWDIQVEMYFGSSRVSEKKLSWLNNLEKFKNGSTLVYQPVYGQLTENIVEYLMDPTNRLYIINNAITNGHYFIQDNPENKPIHITQSNVYYEQLAEIIMIVKKCIQLNIHKNLYITLPWINPDGPPSNEYSRFF